MRADQLEAWVLLLVDRVSAGQPLEDDRVELKADWIDPSKAARRIAGQANASGGAPVLWIVGLDERKRAVVPTSAEDPARWMGRVEGHFDGLAPAVTTLCVPTTGGSVYALLFDSTRRPFVVRSGGDVLEVPWRDGTRVRSARREDLVRLLVPLTGRPSFELLDASVSMYTATEYGRKVEPKNVWHAKMLLYVTPADRERVVLPVHRAAFELTTSEEDRPLTMRVSMEPPSSRATQRSDSHTIATTAGEAIVDGPGRLYVRGERYVPGRQLGGEQPRVGLRLSMRTATDETPLELALGLRAAPPDKRPNGSVERWKWVLERN